jgi:clan AA aspartic protease
VGVTYITGTVRGPSKQETVEFLVDSGAGYTVLPQDVWHRIGLHPSRRQEFRLADGTPIERDMSECSIRLPQGETTTPVILGEERDEALLGVVTLEEIGLVLNPLNRELQPARMRM